MILQFSFFPPELSEANPSVSANPSKCKAPVRIAKSMITTHRRGRGKTKASQWAEESP
jgi:hypothetical protein